VTRGTSWIERHGSVGDSDHGIHRDGNTDIDIDSDSDSDTDSDIDTYGNNDTDSDVQDRTRRGT
jgi:hypothetical protein